MTSTKACGKCGKEYDASPQYFHRKRDNPDGLHSICKSCKNKYDVEYRKKIKEDRACLVYGKTNIGPQRCGVCHANMKQPRFSLWLCHRCLPRRLGFSSNGSSNSVCFSCPFLLRCNELVRRYRPVLCELWDDNDRQRANKPMIWQEPVYA